MSAVTTLRRLSPADHGMPITNGALAACRGASGYKFEVIDGRLYVSYEPDLPEDYVDEWLHTKVKAYARDHPQVINYVTRKARVFVSNRPGDTVPEPDLAAYHDFPHDRDINEMAWQDIDPLLVAEILSRHDPHKDLVRNVGLYRRVPSIREYWIFDTRDNPKLPMMLVYRRGRGKWRQPLEISGGKTYTTKLLPGFELRLDVRS